jgi:exonuclease SbcC
MKITLKNFRCYENSSFNFGDKGIVLVSGQSGVGKSSIFIAIYFALYGVGTKVTMYGKTSCSVILEFDGILITRNKRPSRLIVKDENGVYEDDVGQSVINKKFGETFETTGYICQNAINSFILLSPLDKLGFIEKFAFQDTDLCQIKTRCKHLINDRYETLLRTTSQLEMASEMIKEIKEPEYIMFPIKNGNKEIPVKLRHRSIKNLHVKYKNINVLICKNRKKNSILEKEYKSIEILEAKINSKIELISSIDNKLITENEDLGTYIKSLESIEKYEEQLSFILTQKELLSLESRYKDDIKRLNDMKKNELYEISDKIKDIEKNIWSEYTEEESTTTISEYKQIIKDLESIKQLKNEIIRFTVDEDQLQIDFSLLEKLKDDLTKKKKLQDILEIQKGVFECPSCNKHLKFVSEKLEIVKDVIIFEKELDNSLYEEILKLNKQILNLENSISSRNNKIDRYKELEKNISNISSHYLDDDNKNLPDLNEINKDLLYMKKYINSQQDILRELTSLKILEKQINDDQKYSKSIMSFDELTQNQKTKIEYLLKQINEVGHINISYDEETIRNKIINEQKKHTKIDDLKNNIKNLIRDKKECEQYIKSYNENHIKEYKIECRKLFEVELELKDNVKEFENLESDKKSLEEDMEKLKKYEQYEKELESYNNWVGKIKDLEKEESEHRKQYGASTMLKDKILEAESIAMLNIISSINTHSQVYLDCFFPDNPISVKLVPFRETKKGSTITKKPQINLEIEYKGMEADLSSLSGGEISRVILAFTLALGEMFNSPIMLLDECTASLDQELTNEVMDGIRNNFNGKLVLIIAHQVIKGNYDTVIEI